MLGHHQDQLAQADEEQEEEEAKEVAEEEVMVAEEVAEEAGLQQVGAAVGLRQLIKCSNTSSQQWDTQIIGQIRRNSTILAAEKGRKSSANVYGSG